MALTIVKVGGGLMAHRESLDTILAEIATVSRDVPLLIVPGGGLFADAVRAADRALALTDEAAHWAAILAMDQYAHVLAARLSNATMVERIARVGPVLSNGEVPVLAPYRWLRESDPLPHSWDVSSDSIAAWIAGASGAHRLVLVKPPGASGDGIVDPCFQKVLPAGVEAHIVAADRLPVLRMALRAGIRDP